MLVLILDTYQLMGSFQQLNKIYQVGLQLFKKGTKFYERYGSMNTVYDFFHPISLSHTLPNPKDTHTIPRIPTKRFLAPTPVL
jgi:hypothetical protein